jgi:uncharacterized protein YqgV (UPF0045/DUF77 family)
MGKYRLLYSLTVVAIFITFSLHSGCKKQRIEFAEKFDDVSSEFDSAFEKSDFVNIEFAQTLTLCPIPLSQKDVLFFLDPASQPEKIPLAIIISEELKTPFLTSLIFSNMLDIPCQERRKCSFKAKEISYNIEKEEKNIQEGYKKEVIKINTDKGKITITKYTKPFTNEIVENISVELENQKKENIKFASKITEIEGEIKTYMIKIIAFHEKVQDNVQDRFYCKSEIKIYVDQRQVSISLISNEGKQNFYGYIKQRNDCPQKPDVSMSSGFGLIETGQKCDFLFPTSNIEFFSSIVKTKAESFDEFYIDLLEKIGNKFEIFTQELYLIKLAKELKVLAQSFSIIKIMYDQSFSESIYEKIQNVEKILDQIKVAIPHKIKLQFSDNFLIEITKPVNEPTIIFLKTYIQALKTILSYIKSLDLNLPESLKNQILNEIRQKQSLRMSEKTSILLRSLEGSKSFLMTSEKTARENAFSELKKLAEIFLKFISKIQNYDLGVFAKDEKGTYIQTQKGKFYFSIPKYPDVITQILEGGVYYYSTNYQLFMRFLQDFLWKIYSAGEGKDDFLDFILYILNKINTNYHLIVYIDLPKIFFSDLRKILPAWTKDKFAIEWECSFPEKITCDGEIYDSEHFSAELIFSEPITENITTWNFKFPKDNLKTRFPYIIYKEPSFFGALRINLVDLGNMNLISKVCGTYIYPLQQYEYTPQGKEGICILNLFVAYLTRE